jgi:hypothetical protein
LPLPFGRVIVSRMIEVKDGRKIERQEDLGLRPAVRATLLRQPLNNLHNANRSATADTFTAQAKIYDSNVADASAAE